MKEWVGNNNTVSFSRLRQGIAYYIISHVNESGLFLRYEFPVPLSDIGDATLECHDKAIMFMRYIRKAKEEGTFILIEKSVADIF